MFADPITTLLIAFTAWFAANVEHARQQKETVAAIHELGGSVHYDYQKSRPDVANAFNPRAVPRVPQLFLQLLGDDFFRTVVMVSLRDTNTADEDLRLLQHFSCLENLDLSHTGVTSAGMAHLRGHTNMQFLCLWNTEVDDEGLKHVSGMTKLRALILDGTLVSDAGLEHLKDLTDLEEWLGLTGLLISDDGLKHLKGLTRLRSVNLRNTNVTAAGAADLSAALPQTRAIGVSTGPIADLTLADLLAVHDSYGLAARSHFGTLLRHRIETVHRMCGLTPAQRRKLQLAGRGDIRRGVDRIEKLQRDSRNSVSDERPAHNLDASAKPGDRPIDSATFGEGSLFLKSLETTLTAEQIRHYEPFRDLLRQGVQVQIWPGLPSPVLAVRLHGTECTDTALHKLIAVKTLRHLSLHHVPVSDAALDDLKLMTGLRKLWLTGTKVSDAGVADLKRALPELIVER